MRNQPYNRSEASHFRKPLNYKVYYVLLIRTKKDNKWSWDEDCGSWSQAVVEQAKREWNRIEPQTQLKVITSPTDDDKVISAIVTRMNVFNL